MHGGRKRRDPDLHAPDDPLDGVASVQESIHFCLEPWTAQKLRPRLSPMLSNQQTLAGMLGTPLPCQGRTCAGTHQCIDRTPACAMAWDDQRKSKSTEIPYGLGINLQPAKALYPIRGCQAYFASRCVSDTRSILMATGSLAGNVCLSASSRSSSMCVNVASDAVCAFLSSGMTCGLLIPPIIASRDGGLWGDGDDRVENITSVPAGPRLVEQLAQDGGCSAGCGFCGTSSIS